MDAPEELRAGFGCCWHPAAGTWGRAVSAGMAEFWRMVSPPLHATRERHSFSITSLIAGPSTTVVSKSSSLSSLHCAKALLCSQDGCIGSRQVHKQEIWCRQPHDTYNVSGPMRDADVQLCKLYLEYQGVALQLTCMRVLRVRGSSAGRVTDGRGLNSCCPECPVLLLITMLATDFVGLHVCPASAL